MKNIILFLTVFMVILVYGVLPTQALIRGFDAKDYPNTKLSGMGVFFAPQEVEIYQEPSPESSVIEKIRYSDRSLALDSMTSDILNPEDVYISFYPYKKIALMTVVDNVEDWIQVVYDHKNNLRGWINLGDCPPKTEYNPNVGNYFTWYEFIKGIASKKGIYYLEGVDDKYKKLRAADDDEAKSVYKDFTHVKSMIIKLIRGNWMLVKASDFDSSSPIGWIRWRDDNGNIMIFCNMD